MLQTLSRRNSSNTERPTPDNISTASVDTSISGTNSTASTPVTPRSNKWSLSGSKKRSSWISRGGDKDNGNSKSKNGSNHDTSNHNTVSAMEVPPSTSLDESIRSESKILQTIQKNHEDRIQELLSQLMEYEGRDSEQSGHLQLLIGQIEDMSTQLDAKDAELAQERAAHHRTQQEIEELSDVFVKSEEQQQILEEENELLKLELEEAQQQGKKEGDNNDTSTGDNGQQSSDDNTPNLSKTASDNDELLLGQVEDLSAQLMAKDVELTREKSFNHKTQQELHELHELIAQTDEVQGELERENEELKGDLEAQKQKLQTLLQQQQKEDLQQPKSTTSLESSLDGSSRGVTEREHQVHQEAKLKMLQDQLSLVHQQHQEAVKDHDKLLAQTREDHQHAMEAAQASHEKELEALRTENKQLKEQLVQANQQQQQSLPAAAAPSDNASSSSDSQQQQQAMMIQTLQQELQKLRDGHSAEMDEILAQLDLVEDEHAQQLDQAKQESHVMITALTTELTTKAQQYQTMHDQLLHSQQQEQSLTQQLEHTRNQLQQAATELQTLQDEFSSSMETARQQAADQARQETIEQAESQFENANQMYMQLKDSYTELLDQKAVLEEEMDHTQRELEELQRVAQEQQEGFKGQLKQLQQNLDQVQGIAVQDKQHFQNELERFQQVHDGLIQQLQQAQESHHTLEKTLAMLVMEKESLAQENADLKGVCEETMSLLETYQQGGQQS